MALSNIFVEPKREITESLIGIIVVLIPLTAWYLISSYLAEVTWDPNYMEREKLDVCPYPLWVAMFMATTFIAAFIIWGLSAGFLIFTHFVGEIICDSLQYKNINLRPKQRYERTWRGEIKKREERYY